MAFSTWGSSSVPTPHVWGGDSVTDPGCKRLRSELSHEDERIEEAGKRARIQHEQQEEKEVPACGLAVAAMQDAVDEGGRPSRHSNSAGPSRTDITTAFVKGLKATLADGELDALFASACGGVKSVRLVRDPHGRFKVSGRLRRPHSLAINAGT